MTADGEQSAGSNAEKPENGTPNGEKPGWWRRNQRAREQMDLPSYDPPRFDDEVYVHDVVPELEAAHDCEITFIGINVAYPDEWEVRIDGVPEFAVDRSRNENGNTIYHLDSTAFRERVEQAVSSQ